MKTNILLHDVRNRVATFLFAAAVLFTSHAVIAAPAITATKDDGVAPGVKKNPGDQIQYTITIGNSNAVGTTDALNLQLTDATPANTTDVAGSLVASPVAVDDTYPQTVIGNVSINSASIPYSVVGNDYVGLNPTATIDLVQAISAVVTNTITATTAQGGTVVMTVSGTDIGKFAYNPPAGFEGSDTFTYRLSDNTNATSAATNRTATVTIPVSGMVWFINNAAGAGDGRLSSPFNTLAAFQAVNDGVGNHPAASDNIFIYESATDYTGPVTLLNNQKLIGQDATASLATITGLNPPSGSAAFPAMNSGNGTIVNVTTTAAGTNAIQIANTASATIRGLTMGNTTGASLANAGAGFGTLTVSDVSKNGTGAALNLTSGTLNGTFGSISSTNSAATGISLSSVAGSLTSGSTTITNPTGIGISVGTSSATLSFAATSVTGSGGTGISLLTNTGTTTFGALTITPDSGQRGLLATDNTNTITVPSGTVTTTGNTAVEI
ncbi:MAG TPA: right-handed parallel beta-helix repeat-containing protein, partial [Chthoniobacterales bacterium]|nr:right-handed parallel beta-helix repeat-containing protein [Chthoniobacterales bacterium]